MIPTFELKKNYENVSTQACHNGINVLRLGFEYNCIVSEEGKAQLTLD